MGVPWNNIMVIEWSLNGDFMIFDGMFIRTQWVISKPSNHQFYMWYVYHSQMGGL